MALEAGCFDVDDRNGRATRRRKPSDDGRRDLSCPPLLHPSTWHSRRRAYRATSIFFSSLVLGQHELRESRLLSVSPRGAPMRASYRGMRSPKVLSYNLDGTIGSQTTWARLREGADRFGAHFKASTETSAHAHRRC